MISNELKGECATAGACVCLRILQPFIFSNDGAAALAETLDILSELLLTAVLNLLTAAGIPLAHAERRGAQHFATHIAQTYV